MKRNPAITVTSGVAVAALLAGPLALTTTSAQGADDGARQAATYQVSAKLNKDVVTVDEDVVKIRGKVKPKAAGEKVVLQQRLEGKKSWSDSGKVKIKKDGTYLLKDEPSTPGTREYRVLKPATDGIKKGTSKVMEVVVYRWERLAARPTGAFLNVNTWETALIGTKPFPYSLQPEVAGQPSYVEYTLGRLCTGLRTTYALTDESVSGSTGGVRLLVDGVVKVAQSLVVGQVVESTTDLTNAFRLRYEFISTAAPVASYPAAGTPEVRCTR
jgi:hypothetical protein